MRASGKSPVSRSPSLLIQALRLNKKPFPWTKAWCAGIVAALPVFIGIWLGHFQYGLIAGMGGFTYLYVFNIPYAQRAKRLLFVVLGMTFVSALGTWTAPYPRLTAVLMGVIGAVVIFIFGVLRISGPSAIFFVLVFALTAGMPVQPELAPVRAGLVFLGGALSFVIAMIGWFFKPHGPEKGVVKRVYGELAALVESVGTEKFDESKDRVVSVLKEAEDTLAAGFISWRQTDLFNRLYVYNQHANKIFVYILEHFSQNSSKLPPELGQTIREMTVSLDIKDMRQRVYKEIIQPDEMTEEVAALFTMIYDADAVMNVPASTIQQWIERSKPSSKKMFDIAIDKNSIVLLSTLRFGAVTIIAALIAHELHLARSYWVPLSCVAVMSGSTIVATYHRAIQRGLGTTVGILIAGFILAAQPSGYMIALFILILTFITELFIVKNYGLAAMFFTPSALLMAESTSQGSFGFSYFASARVIDVLIGIVFGLIGVWFVGRRSASSRLPQLIAQTIRTKAQLLFRLFSGHGAVREIEANHDIKKLKIHIMNLKTLYQTAAGEIPVDQKAVEYYWSVIFAIERLGYLLESCSKEAKCPIVPDKELAQILYVCESMAHAAERKQTPPAINVPEMESSPSIRHELVLLQKALQI